jgi:hypothetical protein
MRPQRAHQRPQTHGWSERASSCVCLRWWRGGVGQGVKGVRGERGGAVDAPGRAIWPRDAVIQRNPGPVNPSDCHFRARPVGEGKRLHSDGRALQWHTMRCRFTRTPTPHNARSASEAGCHCGGCKGACSGKWMPTACCKAPAPLTTCASPCAHAQCSTCHAHAHDATPACECRRPKHAGVVVGVWVMMFPLHTLP